MAMTKQLYKNNSIIFRTIDELVPKDHLVRKLDECMNFSFIEDKVEHLYSKGGRSSIPPIVLFKLIFINKIFGINSIKRTCEECEVNLAYRWFLGLSIDDDIPNYSTWSQNYIRRYKNSNIFNEIFDQILKQVIEYGYIDLEAVFYDRTHQKANATMIFACHNLKKMALWHNKNNPNMDKNTKELDDIIDILLKMVKKKSRYLFKYLLCQQFEIRNIIF